MGKDDFDLFSFYCWQLNIKTLEQLARWKQGHKGNSNAELLEALAKAYNGTEWEQINGIN